MATVMATAMTTAMSMQQATSHKPKPQNPNRKPRGLDMLMGGGRMCIEFETTNKPTANSAHHGQITNANIKNRKQKAE
jgi:hypothetical protein